MGCCGSEKECEMKYKASKYNLLFDFQESNSFQKQKIIYNSRVGSLALLEFEKYREYK